MVAKRVAVESQVIAEPEGKTRSFVIASMGVDMHLRAIGAEFVGECASRVMAPGFGTRRAATGPSRGWWVCGDASPAMQGGCGWRTRGGWQGVHACFGGHHHPSVRRIVIFLGCAPHGTDCAVRL
ncbi:hypothetical protein GCM10028793_43520 [Nocardiopsis oceani]